MKRKFEATIIWCEARYSKEVEIEVTEEKMESLMTYGRIPVTGKLFLQV